MASLVDDLMVISSQGRAGHSMLQIALVRPQQLAVQAAAFARPRFEQRGLLLLVRADPDVPEIAADGTRILRVLGNLLDNAAKFTERGGNVVLEVQEAASSVRFSVSNSGTPLRDEQRERLFQPFWQAGHEDRRGLGLGLSICRSMVEAHGGTIWTESAPGMRLKVSFLLPRARALA
ncbi:MAG: sensor histidine kinase [Ramlibacter sp.]